MKIILKFVLAAMFFPLGLAAQTFEYNYRGVDFKCKVKQGKIIIYGFNQDVGKVVIPAQVKDKRGKTLSVSVVDFYSEALSYKASPVAIFPPHR